MNYYNVVLLPTTQAVNQTFVEQAQAIKNYSNGYLLGQNAEPHITLCQFTTEQNDNALPELWESMKNVSYPRFLYVEQKIDVWEGLGQYESFDWVVWNITNSQSLSKTQKTVYGILADSKHYLIPLTSPDHYRPHVTLGRVHEDSVDKNFLTLAPENPAKFEVTLALGRSTINGEWQETLFKV